MDDKDQLSAADSLHLELLKWIEQNEFCKAEDYLYENYLPGSDEHLKFAAKFIKG